MVMKPGGEMSKSTKRKLERSIGDRVLPDQVPPMSRQKASLDTPVPVPLGTIQAMSEFINQATGPCQLAMQIMRSLQLSVDRAGLGQQPAAPQKK